MEGPTEFLRDPFPIGGVNLGRCHPDILFRLLTVFAVKRTQICDHLLRGRHHAISVVEFAGKVGPDCSGEVSFLSRTRREGTARRSATSRRSAGCPGCEQANPSQCRQSPCTCRHPSPSPTPAMTYLFRPRSVQLRPSVPRRYDCDKSRSNLPPVTPILRSTKSIRVSGFY